jgi:pSer/pThr/pTyr-binding forkhead associated (FHA) protein
MPPPPSKPRPSSVQRGGGDAESDPELQKGTQAKIRVPAPSIARGGAAADDDDPELQKGTQAKMRAPISRGGAAAEDDPERNQGTQAKAKMPAKRPSKGAARRPASNWEAPPGKMSGEQKKGPEYRTGSDYNSLDEEGEEASDYHTGNDYEPLEGGELNLEGDGLDALDPDLGPPKTKGLDLILAEAAGDDASEASDDNATRAGPPLSLEIIAGPDQGKKKKIKGVRLVIGRTPGVDLQLSDQSVSRRHVELVQGDKGVMLRDLESGNGTKVNGEKTAEKLLEHGDEVHIGKTKMRFVDEMAAFKKLREEQESKAAKKEEESKEASAVSSAEAPAAAEGEEGAEAPAAAAEGEGEGEEKSSKTAARPQLERGERKPLTRRGPEPKGVAAMVEKFKALEPKKRLMILGGAGVALILFFVLIAAVKPAPAPVVDPRKGQAAEKMQLARDAIRQEHYEDAIALIESAEKLQPGVDGTKLAAQSRDALAIQRSLESVAQMIEANKFDDARTELARIPQGTIKAEEQKSKLGDALKAAEAKFKRGKIDELLAAGEIEAAKQLFAELPDADQREVAPKFAEAEQQAEDLKKQAELDSRRQAANAVAFKQGKKAEAMALAFAVVQRKFTGNEWQRAGAECDRVIDQNPGDDDIRKRAKLLQQLIPNFGRNYEDGMKKFREGQIASSAKPLRAARGYYQQINMITPLGAEIDEKLAQAAVMAGKDALLREDLATAAVNFRDAVKLDPTDGRAKSGLDEVINRAEDLYQSAYMIRDRDPREALKKFKTVVDVTPAGSATHEKAKNQIAAMQP